MVPALRQTVVADSLCAGMGSKTEPSPTSFQGTIVGNGAQGVCEKCAMPRSASPPSLSRSSRGARLRW